MSTNGKSKRPPGRPSKLTPERRNKILAAVRCGASFKTACAAAGVGESTFYTWKQRAERADAPPEYREFLKELTCAEEEGNAARVAIIMRASKTDWRAAAWLLERMDPERWSLRFKIEHVEKPLTLADALRQIRSDRPERIEHERRGALPCPSE